MRTNTLSITSLALIARSLAAYVPSEPWSTLTPTATIAGATTDYTQTFGISIDPISTSETASASLAKRDVVTQIGDGQIQATTSTETAAAVVTQIGDGQIQATTSTETAAAVVTQIGDGQIQATTSTAAAVVTQIGDGQIQATTSTAAAVVTQIGDGQIQATTETAAAVVTQIGDGQIQATTSTETAAAVVTQIGDGQIQATTSTADAVVTQIGDGQIQATTTTAEESKETSTAEESEETSATETSATETSEETATTTTSDDSSATSTPESDDSDDDAFPVSCLTNSSLAMTLSGSILTDAKGRVGSIVANRQFQFDGPPPQAGAIYAAGWGITDGNLAIGNTTVFYQCLSGNFYNLYDEDIGSECYPVYLKVIDLIDC